ncbi:hypothetical protein, partial [Kitasatospora sp. NPDC057015]
MASDEEQRGAWVMRTTLGDGKPAEWEHAWDPEAKPMSEANYQRLLNILFGPARTLPSQQTGKTNGATMWDSSVQERALDFTDLAIFQVRDLLPFVTGQRTIEPPAVHVACIESFLVNVRLIVDFLCKGNAKLDVRAADFVPGWRVNADLRKRLLGYFTLASQHVMH